MGSNFRVLLLPVLVYCKNDSCPRIVQGTNYQQSKIGTHDNVTVTCIIFCYVQSIPENEELILMGSIQVFLLWGPKGW